MAVKPTAPKVMNGKYGMLYWNGEPIFEVDSFEAKIKIDREDISFVGTMGKDSKMKGFSGEYSFKIKKIFSRGQILFANAIKEGRDVRSQFIGKVDDPDSYGSERLILENCWLNELTFMKFETGKICEEEYGGGFTDYYYADTVAPR